MDIVVEYEAVMCAKGEALKECPKCGIRTYRETCPTCREGRGGLQVDGIPLTGDVEADDLWMRIARGEKVDLNVLAGKPKAPAKDEFVDVKPGDWMNEPFKGADR